MLKDTYSSLDIDMFFSLEGEYENVPKGGYLFLEGQRAKNMYVVTEGLIKIGKFSGDGKELSLRLARSQSIIGELTLFSDDPRYLFNAKAMEDSQVYSITNEVVEKLLLSDPKFSFQFMIVMNEHIRKQHSKFRDLLLCGKKGALYSTLIRLCNTFGIMREDGIYIDTPLTNQDLANYSASTREGVNRLLMNLREKGIISIHGKYITIHDLNYLKTTIGCEDCPPTICRID